MLKHKSKRLQTTQAPTQEASYAQAQTQETSYAQAQKQETSIQTELHRKLFKGWTLDIYTITGVHKYKSDKTLEFLRYDSC